MKIRTSIHRVVPFILPCLLLSITFIHTVNAQCPASSPLVINSAIPAESRCQTSGSITVSASGGSTPYIYSITAGPMTLAAQSSNVLQSLKPGTYTVQVTDNCGTSVTTSATVPGSYTVPSPTASTQTTSCPSNSDGSLTVNVSGGLGPFSYSLISPSPVTAGPQVSNVFTNLPAGTYTYQVSDSCGNFQTRTATVSAPYPESIVGGIGLQYMSCDSFQVTLTVDAGEIKPPYTATLTLPNGTVITNVLSASAFSSHVASYTVNFRYHHVTGNPDNLTFKVTNNCGTTVTSYLSMTFYLDMYVAQNAPVGCGSGYSYTFQPVDGTVALCPTVTYTLINPAGVTLAVQTNNATFSGYPPGNGYKVIRQNCCETDSLTFNWSPPPSYSSISPQRADPYASCKLNLTGEYLNVTANFTKSIVLASGPSSVTLMNGSVFTYTYPDTIQNPNLGSGTIYLTGLTAGTYKVYDLDICGGMDSTTFTIDPSSLREVTMTAKGQVACGSGGSIVVNATSPQSDGRIDINPSGTVLFAYSTPYINTITGLTPGTYDLMYTIFAFALTYYTWIYPTGLPTGCDVLRNTVQVPTYVQPSFSTTPAIANCGTTRDVALLPDSTSGVQPYTFQITAGPQTTTTQSSPVFTGLPVGTYTFQMVDACANSYSGNITINTLTVPTVTTSGGNCAGGAATFTLPVNPFNSYTWQHPDGTITTGDTLSFNPITSKDTGTYTITATSTIGGCTSTSSKSLTLGFCTVLQETLLHFSGQPKAGDIQLSWQMADGAGISNYIVERSTDGTSFTPVQQVTAANATQDTYTAIDTHVPAGAVYYRLAMVGNDGAINYSQTIAFNMNNTSSFTVAPRLITGNTPVRCTYPGAGNTGFIRVVGVDGRVYRTITVPAGSTATSIDVSGLARGNYFIVFAGNDTLAATQVWKE